MSRARFEVHHNDYGDRWWAYAVFDPSFHLAGQVCSHPATAIASATWECFRQRRALREYIRLVG